LDIFIVSTNSKTSPSLADQAKSLLAYSLYIVLFSCLLPLFFIRLLWRSNKSPAYRSRMSERLGLAAVTPPAGGIWLHAVSVGEVIAAVPVIKTLRQQYPSTAITVTTSTPTGSARLTEMLADELGNNLFHSYAPYDWPLFVSVFLRKIKPSIHIVMETELWPVTIYLCQCMNIPVVVANARMSEKSAKGYQRFAWLSSAMMRNVHVATQYQQDAEHYLALGLPPQQLQVTGSIKFDIEISPALMLAANQFRSQLNNEAKKTFIWLGASTHKGEDEYLLATHKKVLKQDPNALLIIVPRHLERFDDVANLTESQGFQLHRHSSSQALDAEKNVLLIDSIGQLLLFYGVADVAFVGGSLVPTGGHNTIEPVAWGIPVLSGPHTFNFSEVTERLVQAGALQIIDDSQQLTVAILKLLKDSKQLTLGAAAARQVIDDNRGAKQKLMGVIASLLTIE
jgi:3-deoxy-D-manno-octulosonic-acid transferase